MNGSMRHRLPLEQTGRPYRVLDITMQSRRSRRQPRILPGERENPPGDFQYKQMELDGENVRPPRVLITESNVTINQV